MIFGPIEPLKGNGKPAWSKTKAPEAQGEVRVWQPLAQ